MADFDEGLFDPCSFDGMTPAERLAYYERTGQTVSSEGGQYLLSHIGDEISARVIGFSFSDNQKVPTLLTSKGDIVQLRYSVTTNKLEGVRVSPKASNEAVYVAMAAFVAAGESIDPAKVTFGRTQGFEDRFRPVWTDAYNRWLVTGKIAPSPIHEMELRRPRSPIAASHHAA